MDTSQLLNKFLAFETPKGIRTGFCVSTAGPCVNLIMPDTTLHYLAPSGEVRVLVFQRRGASFYPRGELGIPVLFKPDLLFIRSSEYHFIDLKVNNLINSDWLNFNSFQPGSTLFDKTTAETYEPKFARYVADLPHGLLLLEIDGQKFVGKKENYLPVYVVKEIGDRTTREFHLEFYDNDLEKATNHYSGEKRWTMLLDQFKRSPDGCVITKTCAYLNFGTNTTLSTGRDFYWKSAVWQDSYKWLFEINRKEYL